jgi:hypothetical protein
MDHLQEAYDATTKIIDAQQAKLHKTYKNTKLKLLKTNAAIWFNKTNVGSLKIVHMD